MLKRTNLKAFLGGMALWFLWLLAILWAEISIIIFIIGMGFVCQCDTISGFAYSFGAGTNIYLVAAGIFCGLLTGFVQWLILRKRIEHARGWLWATTAGSVIGQEIGGIVLRRANCRAGGSRPAPTAAARAQTGAIGQPAGASTSSATGRRGT